MLKSDLVGVRQFDCFFSKRVPPPSHLASASAGAFFYCKSAISRILS